MSLLEVLNVLRRRGWILLLATALTAVSAYAFSLWQTTIWEASVRVLVQPTRPDLGLTSSAKNLLRSYVQWMNTRESAGRIINELQLDLVAENLLGNATITSEEENFIIRVDVRDPSIETASQVAYRWAELFVQWRESENARSRREDQVSGIILDQPVVTRYRPQTTINVLAGGILGALIGGLIVFVLEYLDANIIRSRQDLERGLGLAVLSSVPVLESGRRKGS